MTVPAADRYTPVGGLARATATAEIHAPVPGLGDKWDAFAFLDGGKIWTPDERFALNAGELALNMVSGFVNNGSIVTADGTALVLNTEGTYGPASTITGPAAAVFLSGTPTSLPAN